MRSVVDPTPRAFTLVELLVVVTILALVSAMVIPQIGRRDDLETASAAREVVADLLYVQSRAIATGQTLYVTFGPEQGEYRVMDSVSPAHVIGQPVLGTPFDVKFRDGPLRNVKQCVANFDGQATVAFDALGMPLSYSESTQALSSLKAGSIRLGSRGATLTVSIEAGSGQITVQ